VNQDERDAVSAAVHLVVHLNTVHRRVSAREGRESDTDACDRA
jgi:hypothetical protein